MARSVAEAVSRKMAAVTKAVAGNDLRSTLTDVGVESKKLIEREVKRDFGADLGMSNWRRGRVVKLRSGFDQPADDTLVFNPRPHGVWVVAEEGRRAGSTSRPRRRRGSARRGPSSWGASPGKRTWTRSQRMIRADTPKLFRRVQIDKVRKAFTKG